MHRPSLLLLLCLVMLGQPLWANPGHETASGTAPDQALTLLQDGNQRYIDGKATHAKQDVERRKSLVAGQKPDAIILSCSDSRVPPEIIFDKGLGEIFVVRVAGNILGSAAVASIEYAVEHLGTRLIVVLGHESCGAVKATLTTPPGKSAGSTDLDSLVAEIRSNTEGLDVKAALAEPGLRKASMMNVDSVAARLLKRSRIVRALVEKGTVRIVKGIYGLETGKVDFWGVTAK